jgi:hypothetical protein
MPGLMAALDALQGKCRLAIATSATRRFVDVVLPKHGIGSRSMCYDLVTIFLFSVRLLQHYHRSIAIERRRI